MWLGKKMLRHVSYAPEIRIEAEIIKIFFSSDSI